MAEARGSFLCLFREATQRKTEGAIDRVTRDEELRTKFQKHAVRVANCRRPVVALTADDRHSAVVTFAVARGGTGYCGRNRLQVFFEVDARRHKSFEVSLVDI